MPGTDKKTKIKSIKKADTQKIAAGKKTTAAKDVKKAAGTISAAGVEIKGNKEGTISLSKELFAVKESPTLLSQAVRVFLANQRQGTKSTKTRSMVAGSTRKIYKQKGTGRARHGDIKAPIFIGGGTAHGPHPRDFSLSLSKKMKRKALAMALTSRLQENAITIVAGLQKLAPKTREMAQVLENIK